MLQCKTARKACDLCYRKRIKCDSQRPRCSHCVIYDSPCTFEAASRKVRARGRGSSQDKKRTSNRDIDALQSKVKQLEAHLSQSLENIHELEAALAESKRVTPVSPVVPAQALLDELEFTDRHSRILELPPLDYVLPIIEKYLATFNIFMPLFHPGRLLHSVNNWYANSGQRDVTTWAVINIVLALAHRQISADYSSSSKGVSYYANNVQSVLVEVMMGEAHLANVQIVAGMALLLQATQDPKPATVLTSAAIRLANELGLHSRKSSERLDVSAAEERRLVFWVVYILDQDLSMRTKQAPAQLEADIDTDLPPASLGTDAAEQGSGVGFVFAAEGSASFNFLRARVQLARIQGRVYEYMYSTRAQVLNAHQQSDNTARLQRMLDDWMSSVPAQFRPAAILRAGEPSLGRYFAIMYAAHLACRTLVCRAHIMETCWLRDLHSFGRVVAQQGFTTEPPPLPQAWQVVLVEAREFILLFMKVEPKDNAFIWMTACTYISGAVCLTANNMCSPGHGHLEFDKNLVDLSLLFLEELARQMQFEPLNRARDAYRDLTHSAYTINCVYENRF